NAMIASPADAIRKIRLLYLGSITGYVQYRPRRNASSATKLQNISLNSTVSRAWRYARDSASLPDSAHGARSLRRDLDGSPTISTVAAILPERVIVHALFTQRKAMISTASC